MIGSTVIIFPASTVALGATANLGNVFFGLTNYFGDIIIHSIDNTLLLNLGLKVSRNLFLSTYFTLINKNSSRSRYGANASF